MKYRGLFVMPGQRMACDDAMRGREELEQVAEGRSASGCPDEGVPWGGKLAASRVASQVWGSWPFRWWGSADGLAESRMGFLGFVIHWGVLRVAIDLLLDCKTGLDPLVRLE